MSLISEYSSIEYPLVDGYEQITEYMHYSGAVRDNLNALNKLKNTRRSCTCHPCRGVHQKGMTQISSFGALVLSGDGLLRGSSDAIWLIERRGGPVRVYFEAPNVAQDGMRRCSSVAPAWARANSRAPSGRESWTDWYIPSANFAWSTPCCCTQRAWCDGRNVFG